jgi:hypothetical protein
MKKAKPMKLIMESTDMILRKRGMQKGGPVQKFIDSECLRRCAPYIPKDTGELIRSGVRETKKGSGMLIWDTVYARKWYYRPAHFAGAPMRGNYWFVRMKKAGGANAITRGAKQIVRRMDGGF